MWCERNSQVCFEKQRALESIILTRVEFTYRAEGEVCNYPRQNNTFQSELFSKHTSEFASPQNWFRIYELLRCIQCMLFYCVPSPEKSHYMYVYPIRIFGKPILENSTEKLNKSIIWITDISINIFWVVSFLNATTTTNVSQSNCETTTVY